MSDHLTEKERVQVEVLLSSPGWRLVAGYLEAMLDVERQQLESDHDAVKTARIRGRVAMLREVLLLPGSLLAKEE